MLNVLGLAIGATAVDATAAQTPGASTFGIGAGIWLLVANTLGLLAGGYVAARLSGSGDSTDSALHGLSVWAIGFLLSAVLLGNIVAGTANTAFQGASSIIGGVVQGAGSAAGGAASAASGPLAQAAQQVNPQQLVERAQNALRSAGGDPAQMNSDQRNAEIVQILTRRVTDGNLPQDARDRLNRLVGAEYGIAPEEAQRRVQQVEQQAQQAAQVAEQRAREAADAAATGGAVAAYWIFAAMLLGAVAAVLGARFGTRHGPAARAYA
ncbi:hypothetical protein E2C05_00335 [Paracraurococcus ruber]|uniref:PhnA-like protein n=2 Tax=Paracraurococcus ruber TaxID=77675 RepID=A0ABS1CRR0_9PROT|nr:hypothetical protein [Paracraurococcus ruber]TDG34331.1 hypothetical protein E2C05_00335 [Paracraurococcus ruber]